MPSKPRSSREHVAFDSGDLITNSLCDRFERQWRSGQRPGLETYLAETPEELRGEVMRELLILDIEYRLLGGERVAAAEYLRQFPDNPGEIEYAWRAITAEYEPDTHENAARSASDQPSDTERSAVAHQVLDGRRFASKDEWSPRPPAGTSDAQESLVMQSELTSVQYHARGGLGVVCRATDQRLGRPMAVKFIRRELAHVGECRERLQLEAEITSRLDHPGVVPVYGIGKTSTGRLFYAMRFIHGETLDTAIDRCHRESAGKGRGTEHDIRVRELLGHFVAVCKTVAYAHERGIVHRDIKPANIMLGRYGETTLVDWGLAASVRREGPFKVTSEETLKPASAFDSSDSRGGTAGTPAFMSPEQAAGDACLRPASDIYSLGATLYKLITGRPPFSGPLNTVRAQVLRGEFRRPTDVNPGASHALEAICCQAMSLEPDDRYPTALDLARDIENFLADADVAAYREPLTRRIARWARRHWAGVQLAITAFALIAFALLVAAVLLGRQARLEREWTRAAWAAEQREHGLRKQGVSASAEFAAQMIANQVDLRWCVLEKMARDARLQTALGAANSDPLTPTHWLPLQAWLDAIAAQHAHLRFHALFVNAADGTQVARYPDSTAAGTRMPSIGRNFRYRDYFHGLGGDYHDDPDTPRDPSGAPHVSTAFESSNYAQLSVVFSVPVFADDTLRPAGILGMMVDLGDFAALEVALPPGQQMLLVDTRDYTLRRTAPARNQRGADDEPVPGENIHDESGAGLVLFHQDLTDLRGLSTLPHVDDATIRRMREWGAEVRQHIRAENASAPRGMMLPSDFADPVSSAPAPRQIAACAPVIVRSRPEPYDTGWFIVIRQAAKIHELSPMSGD
jgi:eukaryotic-like serine/threonine-protein kinase